MKKLLTNLTCLFIFLNSTMAQLYDKASMPGATFYFSDKPFVNNHDGAKTTFKSNEFIYGRIEFENKTLKEAFQLDNIKKGPYYLFYHVMSYKNDRQTGYSNSIWNALQVKDDQLNNKWLNFDILPEPSKAANGIGRVNEQGIGEFDKVDAAPMYAIIKSENFPGDGEYTIYVQFYLQTRDAWGNRTDDKKWPLAEGSFSLDFNGNDVAALQDNWKAAGEKLSAVHVDKLPAYFTNPVKISDPTVTVAKVTPLIKNYLQGYEVLKIAIEPASSMWSIVKNDLGLLSYRYVTSYYRIVYKKDGKCQLGSVRVLQDYVGDGKYGNLYCKFWGDEGMIDCNKVK